MKIGVIGCHHETNTFSPGLTQIQDFKEEWVVGKDSFYHFYEGTKTTMGGAIDAAKQYNFELVPMFYTQTMPSPIVSQEAVNQILKEMINRLNKEKDELDCLLVILHGAMVSEDWQDVEGKMLQQIRDVFGNELIGVTVDLHANISEKMVQYSNIIVGYDTYPHIDTYERAVEICEILTRCHQEQISPIIHLERTNLLIAPTLMDTNIQPMATLMNKVFEYEEDEEILNITIAGGFAFSDVYCAGSTVLVTTSKNENKARKIAKYLADWMIAHQEEFAPVLYSLDQVKEMIENDNLYPVVLVESSDNVGGGSPADATHTLDFLLANNLKKFLIVISDPDAVKTAVSKGVNSTVTLQVGAKTDKKFKRESLHGFPVNIIGKVKLISNGEYTHKGPYMSGIKASMGMTAVIDLIDNDATIILTEKRVAPWDINHIKSVGIDPEIYNIIVVKAAVAWRTAFENIAKNAYELDTPGACSSNLSHFKFENIPPTVKIICREGVR